MPIASISNNILCTSPVDSDVDFLMKRISETLKLKACQKQIYYGCKNRPTPYGVAHSSQRSTTHRGSQNSRSLSTSCKQKRSSSDNISNKEDLRTPFDLLQDLLRDGKLVQEAVRRVRVQRQSSVDDASENMSDSCSSRASTYSDGTNSHSDNSTSIKKCGYSEVDSPIFDIE